MSLIDCNPSRLSPLSDLLVKALRQIDLIEALGKHLLFLFVD